jgi:hypothetical protein
MKRAVPLTALLLFLLAVLSLGVPTAQAQGEEDATATPTTTPTMTSTPTPVYEYSFPLTSGNLVQVERSITYGDVAIGITGLALLAFFLISQFLKIPKLWK